MGEYDDIIHLPHYEPKRHPRMPMAARAAQFAPFAAVAGHDAAIREEGRKHIDDLERRETPSPDDAQESPSALFP